MTRRPSPYTVLADIIVSQKVGLAHVWLAGELVAVEARLSAWMYHFGKKQRVFDENFGLLETWSDTKSKYENWWRTISQSDSDHLDVGDLQRLRQALQEALDTLRGLVPEAMDIDWSSLE